MKYAIALRSVTAAVLGALVSTATFADSPPAGRIAISSDPAYQAGEENYRERYSWGRNWLGGVTVPYGKDIRVYVLDTGVGIHEDLNLLQLVNENIDPDSGNPVKAVGCYAHATHVAGIIGAERGNRGVAGMAAGVPLISVSVAIRNARRTDGSGLEADCAAPIAGGADDALINASIIRALNWIKTDITNYGGGKTAVVNISLNDPRWTQGHASGIAAKLYELAQPASGYPGALIVQSAGNFGEPNDGGNLNNCAFAYGPRNDADGILVVGGVDEEGRRGSNYVNDGVPAQIISGGGLGSSVAGVNCVDVWAPSTNIWSTYTTGPYDSSTSEREQATRYYNAASDAYWQKGNVVQTSYRPLSGTSMAAPHIAGLAVGFLLENPYQSPQALEGQIRARALRNFYNNYSDVLNPYKVAFSPFYEYQPWDNLLRSYYQTIFQRTLEQDTSSAREYWHAEIARMVNVQTDVREVFRSLAKNFFFSVEYTQYRNTDIPEHRAAYVTHLYQTFLQRTPDASEVNAWVSQFDAGMNREAVFLHFAFSTEFNNYMASTLGNTIQRPEVSWVIDAYRGALGRLPDPQAFRYWRDRLRTAQCQGPGPVWTEAPAIMRELFGSLEATYRQRSNHQYVADEWDAIFRAGPDGAGLNYWAGRLDGSTGAIMTRPELVDTFLSYAGDRINAIASASCLQCVMEPGGFCQ